MTQDFQHHLFYWSCLVAAVALVGVAMLEAYPNFVEQLVLSVRLIDAIIFAAFGIWSRTGRVLAPIVVFLYCIYLSLETKLAYSPYYYAAIGIYVSVMFTAVLSLYASWQAAQQDAEHTKTE